MTDPDAPTPARTDAAKNGEQRRDSRVRYDFPVFFFFVTGKRRPREVHYVKAYTQDVSQAGIKILVEAPAKETSQKLTSGEPTIELEIYLPAVFRSKPIVARGRPVRLETAGTAGDLIVGVDFTNLDDKQRETLKRVARTLRDVTDVILGDDARLP